MFKIKGETPPKQGKSVDVKYSFVLCSFQKFQALTFSRGKIYVQYLVQVNCEALGCIVGDHPHPEDLYW